MRRVCVLAAAVSLGLAACGGSAMIFYQDGNGGILTLDGDKGKAMEDAERKMASHCGARGHRILKRESVVVGSGIDPNQAAEPSAGGALPPYRPAGAPTSSSAQAFQPEGRNASAARPTEDRVTYVCGT